jgi:hypothetical protein
MRKSERDKLAPRSLFQIPQLGRFLRMIRMKGVPPEWFTARKQQVTGHSVAFEGYC